MPITYFFLFYPFRMESELNRRELPLYYAKLNEPCVIHNTNFKKCSTEVFRDLVDEAFLHIRAQLSSNFDFYAQQ